MEELCHLLKVTYTTCGRAPIPCYQNQRKCTNVAVWESLHWPLQTLSSTPFCVPGGWPLWTPSTKLFCLLVSSWFIKKHYQQEIRRGWGGRRPRSGCVIPGFLPAGPQVGRNSSLYQKFSLQLEVSLGSHNHTLLLPLWITAAAFQTHFHPLFISINTAYSSVNRPFIKLVSWGSWELHVSPGGCRNVATSPMQWCALHQEDVGLMDSISGQTRYREVPRS